MEHTPQDHPEDGEGSERLNDAPGDAERALAVADSKLSTCPDRQQRELEADPPKQRVVLPPTVDSRPNANGIGFLVFRGAHRNHGQYPRWAQIKRRRPMYGDGIAETDGG